MTFKTSLIITGDGKVAKAEVDALRSSVEQLGNSAKGTAPAAQQLDAAIGALGKSSQQMVGQSAQLTGGLGNLSGAVLDGVSALSGLDQQTLQNVKSLGLMKDHAGLLAGALGGVLGLAITAGVALMTDYIASLADAEEGLDSVKFAADELGNAQKILGGVMDLTTGKINTQNNALIALARAQLIAANAQARSRQAEARSQMRDTGQMGWIEASLRGTFTPNTYWAKKMAGNSIGSIMGAVEKGGMSPDLAIQTLEKFNKAGALTDTAFAKAAAAVANFAVEGQNIEKLDAARKTLDGVATSVEKGIVLQAPKATRGLTAVIDREVALATAATASARAQAHLNDVKARAASIDKMAEGAAKDAALLQYRNDLTAATVAYTNAQKADNEARKSSSSAATAHAKAEREAAAEIVKAMKWVADTRAAAQGNVGKLAQEAQKQQQDWGKGLEGLASQVQAAWEELQTIGLSGPALAFANLNQEIEKGRKTALALGADAVAAEEMAENWRHLRTAGINQKSTMEKDAETAAILLDRVGALSAALAGLRGGGGILGDITGVLTSRDPIGAMLGMGGVGSLLGLMTKGGRDAYAEQGKIIAKHIEGIFGVSGKFAQTLAGALQHAGVGSLASDALLGRNGSAIGASIGGAMGGKLGEKFLEKGFEKLPKGLGSFAGPIGSIAGGLVGGIMGGLLKKTRWGTSVVTGQGSDDVAVGGNKAAYRSNADLAGTSIQSGLQSIADQLGADVGGYNVSIGQYKGKWRVSSTGRSGKLKGKYADVTDFGKEGAEDAIKFAIADAVKDGALLGLRASTQVLIQKGDDIEGQLQKAIRFEGVFAELKQRTDPTAYALEELGKKTASLKKLFEEAGASVEEYADLEKLLDMQRKDILDQASKDALDKLNERRELEIRLLTAQGKVAEAANAQREIELSQTKDELKQLMQQVQAEELAGQRRSMEITLLDAMGRKTEALTLRRQAELAALDASLRPLQRAIWYYQDAAGKVSAAKDALSAAYDRESASIRSTADRFRDFARAIGEFRASLFADVPGVDVYGMARARFDKTASLARLGNEASLGAFTGDAQSYLDAARNQAGSALDYARDVARVARAADQAQAGANGVASMADRQLAQMAASVKGLIDLNDNVTSVSQALADLKKAQAEADAAQAEMELLTNPVPALAEVNVNLTDIGDVIARLNATQADTKDLIAALRAEMQAALIAIASNTGESARIARRHDRGTTQAVTVEAA
ncbi:coiled-coil domain-containing protein [Sphingobium cloacae]|uniref:Bacteriophage tail tape measure N-terminal domain-containing protein n=1 Tax=Sphingobium cloacae TaxID=120107 RepID=A0A1E1F2L6_9SPHN|nr:hypothetical protein [Sphingobium cloacae]BAV64763.1 hypothetical protein SCLO_1017230 [Sphingobium cloacae]